MLQTMLLNPQTWDLVISSTRSIALASDPYSLAQDAASAIKLFQGEYYYDTTQGVPYFQDTLGHWPPLTLMKAHFNAAALTVPGVVQARTFINAITDRHPTGQVQITDEAGGFAAIGF